MKTAALLILILFAGLQAWVRLAPSDPRRWDLGSKAHALALEDPAATTPSLATALAGLKGQNPATVGAWVPGPPEEVLARLDAIALARPRTTRLAGDPASHRITWVSRSLLWGFPDYITAEADAQGGGTRLDVLSRQRFGQGDMGVNAARLRDWLGQL